MNKRSEKPKPFQRLHVKRFQTLSTGGAFIIMIMFLSIAGGVLAEQAEIYSQIRVDWGYTQQIGDEIIHARPGVWAEYALPESRLADLDFADIPYRVIIPDMEDYYRRRLDSTMDMGGWRTYAMIKAALDSLHDEYPLFVSEPESIGCGHNGNAIWVIKISDNVDVDEDEPETIVGLGIHCREVITMEIIVQFAQWLMENYGIDDRATHLVDHREIWFVPLMNPDGYRHNELTNPSGGGMWRKNRRNNGDGTWGVDLNRNFPFMWGYDDTGSSPETADQTYRGPSAASEPETQAILELYDSREFKSSISFHSYSNLYLTPWGYTTELCVDNDWFLRIAYRYARNNGYIYGPGSTTIYPTNGDTDDWFYGDTVAHAMILAITPEVGGYGDGFWPDLERKQPLVDENRPACIVNCQVAGSASFMTKAWINDSTGDTSGYADPGENFHLMIELENLGWETSLPYVLAFPEGTGIAILTDTAWADPILSQGYDTTYFEIFLDPSRFDPGDQVKIHFEIRDTSGHLTNDSTSFICGTPHFVHLFDFESGDGGFSSTGDWEYGVPGVGPENAYSGVNLWGTRLDSSYHNNRESILSLPPIIVPDAEDIPRFTFMHWFAFEAPDGDSIYDGGNVQISTNSGVSWTVISPIEGYFGVAYGHNDYVGGDSVFTSMSNGWKYEVFDLAPYAGATVELRFVMGADNYVSHYGWYIDDVALIYYIDSGHLTEESHKPASFSLTSYPNPFNSAVKIRVRGVEDSRVQVEIFDINGKRVQGFEGSRGRGGTPNIDNRAPINEFVWRPGESVGSGVYLVRATIGDEVSSTKVIFLK